MKHTALIFASFILSAAGIVQAQRPPQPPPGAVGPPRGEGQRRPGDGRRPDNAPRGADWFDSFDLNKDQKIDADEIRVAAEASFGLMDKDKSGTLEAREIRPPRPADRQGAGFGEPGVRMEAPPAPPRGEGKPVLPPFFYMKGSDEGSALSASDFATAVRNAFTEMDKNADGFLTKEEARPPRGPGQGPGAAPGPGQPGPPPPPNAQFIGAEMRFGDKLVKGQPFSAETVVEDNRRLFDGTTVSNQNKGSIFRDSAGRTRREQPLNNVGGFNVVGDNAKPQMLIFINDFAAKTQYFLDVNGKMARKSDAPGQRAAARPERDGPEDAKIEPLGTRTIEGVSCEGTRTTFEIPAGQIGNGKPLQVVSERWFSPELQVVVLSKHTDPLAGEHIFKLVNIKRSEPAADLFEVPAGFKVEGPRAPRAKDE